MLSFLITVSLRQLGYTLSLATHLVSSSESGNVPLFSAVTCESLLPGMRRPGNTSRHQWGNSTWWRMLESDNCFWEINFPSRWNNPHAKALMWSWSWDNGQTVILCWFGKSQGSEGRIFRRGNSLAMKQLFCLFLLKVASLYFSSYYRSCSYFWAGALCYIQKCMILYINLQNEFSFLFLHV